MDKLHAKPHGVLRRQSQVRKAQGNGLRISVHLVNSNVGTSRMREGPVARAHLAVSQVISEIADFASAGKAEQPLWRRRRGIAQHGGGWAAFISVHTDCDA